MYKTANIHIYTNNVAKYLSKLSYNLTYHIIFKLSAWRTGFDLSVVRVRFVLDQVALGQISVQVFRFFHVTVTIPLSVVFISLSAFDAI